MEILETFKFDVIDIVDIVLVAVLLYYFYKLVKGTVAINIFIGIVIIYLIFLLTEALKMPLLTKNSRRVHKSGAYRLDCRISAGNS